MEKVKPRLKELYKTEIRPQLKETLGLKNIMQVPTLEKIVLNVGVKEAARDSKSLKAVEDVLALISGQAPVKTKARKSIAGFKIREGMPIGVKVTLRGDKMYEFLDRLINLALPKMRDFQGLSPKLDRQGNYNLGIKEWIIFPEIEFDVSKKVHGLNITFHTSTKKDDEGRELLKKFGMPFAKSKV